MTTGVVLSVDVERYGDTLTAVTAATDLVLQVDDIVDFADEDDFAAGPQWLTVGDSAPMQYVSVDDDADTIMLAAAVGAVYEAGEPVRMWDAAASAAVVSHVAWVELDEADDEDAPIPAEVRHDRMIFFGLDDMAALIGARVSLEPDEDDPEVWHVSEIIGRVPVLDGTYIEPGTLPAASSGQTFSTALPPATADGYAEDHAWWQVVEGEVLGFWRATAGAWVAQEIVTADALQADNALITALNTVDLSTVNFTAVNIDGGSIYVAQSIAQSFDEGFSGTALPTGWTSTKTGGDGTGSGSALVPGASVVSTGPAGQAGSALLVDFGPSGLGSADHAAGEVSTVITDSAAADATARVISQLNGNTPDLCELAILRRDGAAWSTTSDGISVSLLGDNPSGEFGETTFQVISTVNGSRTILGTVGVHGTDPTTQWHRVRLRVAAGRMYAKAWLDSEAEPAAWGFVSGDVGIAGAGKVSVVWQQAPGFGDSRGQKVWVDQFAVESFTTGFQVNPDGTGEWPAIGLRAGDPAWRVVGNAGEPGFVNSWTEFAVDSVKFRKFPTGDVTINADVNIPAGGHNTPIFTLPTTHRPTATFANMFAWQDATGVRVAAVTVNTDGTVVWANLGNTGGIRSSFSVSFSTL